MRQWLLTLELINSPIVWIFVALAVALALVVVLVRPWRGWRLLIALAVGAIGGYVAVIGLEALGAFDGPLPGSASIWAAGGFALAAVGVVGAFSRPWWRRALAVVLVLVALVAAGLGVNRSYGLTHTLATILGIQALESAPLPAATASSDDPATLFQTWTPPADMPAKGRVSALSDAERIPDTGFAARDAALYLPPAALVAHPPKLPLIVFMMGQPGTPDPTSLAAALDAFAAAHHGLAPIAIVVDQLGSINADPACHDSDKYGKVSTYINTDVPAYARTHLNIVDDPAYWVIGGYSNGGACAFAYAAQYPQLWGNLMDVSGNEYPGSEHVAKTTQEVFGGDAAAFEAARPTSWLTRNAGSYGGHAAVFTHGDQDATFGPGQVANAAAAKAAGFTVYETTLPGVNHTGPALDLGLRFAIDSLGPRLGLAAG
ncbi:alpha/beta hydrolase-fold protein [Microbacterium sp. SORGH_AS_0888]|uniref:alpha/beta hydrolase-fold protein n=1 Tax=Microbacterium sp. SORGH_AS_0888 TaxID=3041791 RepID=UPI00277EF61A|nr:alpha/beta hydrolase-fold protein [Microbacterium sp. SORGH_AS_0888]MDQ1127949.1 enterochelin esterase-like enzyme [Microbacterium sp. SORGH_AS_0888]